MPGHVCGPTGEGPTSTDAHSGPGPSWRSVPGGSNFNRYLNSEVAGQTRILGERVESLHLVPAWSRALLSPAWASESIAGLGCYPAARLQRAVGHPYVQRWWCMEHIRLFELGVVRSAWRLVLWNAAHHGHGTDT